MRFPHPPQDLIAIKMLRVNVNCTRILSIENGCDLMYTRTCVQLKSANGCESNQAVCTRLPSNGICQSSLPFAYWNRQSHDRSVHYGSPFHLSTIRYCGNTFQKGNVCSLNVFVHIGSSNRTGFQSAQMLTA